MRKLFLLIAVLIGFGIACAEHTALVVQLKNGRRHVYTFADNPRVTFEGSTVNVFCGAFTNSYEVDDIESYFTEKNDVTTTVDKVDKVDFLFRNVATDRYEVSGSAVREVRVFNLAGLQLERIEAVEGFPVEIDLSDNLPGVYLICVNLGARTETVKVIKK